MVVSITVILYDSDGCIELEVPVSFSLPDDGSYFISGTIALSDKARGIIRRILDKDTEIVIDAIDDHGDDWHL